MNKQLLLALQKRNQERLQQLNTELENENLSQEELDAINAEIEEISKEQDDVATALADLDGEEEEETEARAAAETESTETKETEEKEQKDQAETDTKDTAKTQVSPEARSKAMNAVKSALSTKNAKSTKKKEAEMRSAFANFVIGRISEFEARSLGIEAGNGSVTVPEVIASEVITYAQEENLLRKYGTRVKTKDTQGYPFLVKKAEANVNKKERSTDITETEIEFDEITLDPAEFDALATVSKKLLKRSGVPVEDIVVEELKKAYVRKETNFMFNGDDVGNENPGALAKKAVPFYEKSGDDLYNTLVKMKNTPATEVVKKSRWIINRAALTEVETMKTADGFPLLRPLTQAEGGIGYTLLGFPLDYTDNADGEDATKPVFYFGDFSQFRIQDVIGVMEIQRLVEEYSKQNKVGFQIYNIVDGQLIYSPLAPAVYRYEVGATAPVTP